jgi:hypothetical protein
MSVPLPEKQGKFDVPVMFLITKQQGEKLDCLVKKTGASKSEIGRTALQFYFDALDGESK